MSERSEAPQVTVELAGKTVEERMSLGQLLSWTEAMTLLMARRAVEQGNMEVFLHAAGSSSLNVLAPMARYALGFNRPWDRLVALTEVVLAGEARALGLEAAERRRLEWRGEVLHGLKERIAEVMPRIPEDGAHP